MKSVCHSCSWCFLSVFYSFSVFHMHFETTSFVLAIPALRSRLIVFFEEPLIVKTNLLFLVFSFKVSSMCSNRILVVRSLFNVDLPRILNILLCVRSQENTVILSSITFSSNLVVAQLLLSKIVPISVSFLISSTCNFSVLIKISF